MRGSGQGRILRMDQDQVAKNRSDKLNSVPLPTPTKMEIQYRNDFSIANNKDPTDHQKELHEDEINCIPTKRSRFNFEYGQGSDPDPKVPEPGVNLFDSQTQNHFVLLTNLSPAQAVLSIEKIRNLILAYCCPKDLLKLRQVSRDWLLDETILNALLKWKTNRILISRMWVHGNAKAQRYKLNFNGIWGKPLHELTELMNETGLRQFPCSRFRIDHRNIEGFDPELDIYLNNHGYRITKLHLNLFYQKSCNESRYDYYFTRIVCSHNLNWLLEFVSKILEQTPNLVKLHINSNDHWSSDEVACKPLDKTSKRQSITSKKARSPLNLKLRSVFISVDLGQAMFEWICRIAPNLELLTFRNTTLNHYLEPINRLHLLKVLFYFPDRETFENNAVNNNTIELIANMEGNLQLKELNLFPLYIERDVAFWPQVVDICNKLLTKSCHSLKTLHWTRVGFLPGLKIPQLPNVKYIFLNDFDSGHRSDTNFFPLGTNLAETFPNLHTVELCDFDEDDDNDMQIDFTNGEYFLLGCKKEPAPSVKLVITAGNPVDLHLFQQCFPNAKIVDKVNKVYE